MASVKSLGMQLQLPLTLSSLNKGVGFHKDKVASSCEKGSGPNPGETKQKNTHKLNCHQISQSGNGCSQALGADSTTSQPKQRIFTT